MNMVSKVFTTPDNARLMCATWDDVKKPIGVVQIIHGLFDKISTYDKLAQVLNSNGYIVFGIDSALNKSMRTFDCAVLQEHSITQYLIAKYNLPIFLIGYGYGGFVAQSVSRHTDTPISGVCLVKSVMRNRWTIYTARIFARIGAKVYGKNSHTRIMNIFKRHHCGHTQKYSMCTYGFCESLFDGLIKLDTATKYEKPILIISNADERDTITPQFSRALYNAYNNNDLGNTTMLIYPDMRNKLLVEMNCGQIQDDILSFLNDTYSDISANLNGTILSKSDSAN